MSSYGAYDIRGALRLPLSHIRKLCTKIVKRNFQEMRRIAMAGRVAQATNEDYAAFMRTEPDFEEDSDGGEGGNEYIPESISLVNG